MKRKQLQLVKRNTDQLREEKSLMVVVSITGYRESRAPKLLSFFILLLFTLLSLKVYKLTRKESTHSTRLMQAERCNWNSGGWCNLLLLNCNSLHSSERCREGKKERQVRQAGKGKAWKRHSFTSNQRFRVSEAVDEARGVKDRIKFH